MSDSTTISMPDHQRRVITEKIELDEKIKNLLIFIEGNGPTFQCLHPQEQHRLRAQANLMRQYSSVLADRIAVFGVLPT